MTALHMARAVARLGLITLLAPLGMTALRAQSDAPPAPRPAPALMISLNAGAAGRGYLGVTPRGSSGPADTLGLLVDSVDDSLPAARAGIRRGARLVSIDDVDLRLDPRDLGESAAERLPEIRLRRVLGAKKAGDAVELVVLTDRRRETKRIVLAESPMARTIRSMITGRRSVGLGFAQRGSMRDTAGLLIISITSGSPAEKAGLAEGDRVASVDGIDVRVPAVDAGNRDGVEARIARFRRAIEAARDSQPIRLELLSEGRRRTVTLTPTRDRGWSFDMGVVGNMADDIRENVNSTMRVWMDDGDRDEAFARVREEGERTREAGARMREEGARVRAEGARVREEGAREREETMRARGMMGRGSVRGRTDGATLVLDGLTLASVDRDFAERFGRGSEAGALVVRTRGEWEPLKAGDVILTIEGRPVRDGATLDVTFDRSHDQRLEILRNGRKETITLRSDR